MPTYFEKDSLAGRLTGPYFCLKIPLYEQQRWTETAFPNFLNGYLPSQQAEHTVTGNTGFVKMGKPYSKPQLA